MESCEQNQGNPNSVENPSHKDICVTKETYRNTKNQLITRKNNSQNFFHLIWFIEDKDVQLIIIKKVFNHTK